MVDPLPETTIGININNNTKHTRLTGVNIVWGWGPKTLQNLVEPLEYLSKGPEWHLEKYWQIMEMETEIELSEYFTNDRHTS